MAPLQFGGRGAVRPTVSSIRFLYVRHPEEVLSILRMIRSFTDCGPEIFQRMQSGHRNLEIRSSSDICDLLQQLPVAVRWRSEKVAVDILFDCAAFHQDVEVVEVKFF